MYPAADRHPDTAHQLLHPCVHPLCPNTLPGAHHVPARSPLIPVVPFKARQLPTAAGGLLGGNVGGSRALPSQEPMARCGQVCLSAGSHACAEHPLPCAARHVATATASAATDGGCAGASLGLAERWRMCRSILQSHQEMEDEQDHPLAPLSEEGWARASFELTEQ